MTRRWVGWISMALVFVCGLESGAIAAEQSPRSSAQIAERLAGAIRFETISPENAADFDPQPFRALAAYLARSYPRTHAALELERVNEHTLVFRWQGADPDLLPALFLSHTDVVPVEGTALDQWTHPPYEGTIADGFVWGRGTLDVKTGVIFWLEAVEALLVEGFVPRRTLYLSFGHDEEIGGFDGAAIVAQHFAERGIRLAFLFDEGGMIIDDFPLLPGRVTAQVVIAEKAFYTVRLTARGVSGHSSIPPRSTAIGRLARAIHRMEENPMPGRLIAPMREMIDVLRPHLPWAQRIVLGNLWLTEGMVVSSFSGDPLQSAMIRTTFAATIVAGGVKSNVIPEKAEATINVRILPGDTPEDVLDHLARVIDDPEVEIAGESWGAGAPPASVEGLAFELASDSIHAVIPDAIVLPGMLPGATDSRHFAGVTDEILRFVPMRIGLEQTGGAHGRDERIAVAPLAESVEVAIEMVRRAGQGTSAE